MKKAFAKKEYVNMWIKLTEKCINIFQFCHNFDQTKCQNFSFFIFKVGGDHISEKWEVGEVLLKNYSGRRIHQYNEDGFLSIFLSLTNIFQINCLDVYMFMSLCCLKAW